jgi:hypothetical protein
MSRVSALKLCGALSVSAVVFLTIAATSVFAGETMAAFDGSNPAKNLARMNCGATIDLVGRDGRIVAVVPNSTASNPSVNALILDDDTLSYPLEEGETTFILTLPRALLLDRFTFVNENATAEGEMKIFVSNYRLPARSTKWTDITGSTAFTGKRLVNLSLLGGEARYMKLVFRTAKGGRIAALGLYGTQSLQRFARRQPGVVRVKNVAATRRLEDTLNFNFANLYAKARIVFVSSGTEEFAQRMIDDDVVTSFQFAPADPHPTVVVELAERERLHRISALYNMEAGRLDVYVLQKFGTNPDDLSSLTPIASVTDAVGGGKAAVDFDPQGARYVTLRWTPAQQNRRKSFEVAEVSAFGDMPLSMLSTSELPDIYADNSLGLMSPPLVIQPPVLPVVSP